MSSNNIPESVMLPCIYDPKIDNWRISHRAVTHTKGYQAWMDTQEEHPDDPKRVGKNLKAAFSHFKKMGAKKPARKPIGEVHPNKARPQGPKSQWKKPPKVEFVDLEEPSIKKPEAPAKVRTKQEKARDRRLRQRERRRNSQGSSATSHDDSHSADPRLRRRSQGSSAASNDDSRATDRSMDQESNAQDPPATGTTRDDREAISQIQRTKDLQITESDFSKAVPRSEAIQMAIHKQFTQQLNHLHKQKMDLERKLIPHIAKITHLEKIPEALLNPPQGQPMEVDLPGDTPNIFKCLEELPDFVDEEDSCPRNTSTPVGEEGQRESINTPIPPEGDEGHQAQASSSSKESEVSLETLSQALKTVCQESEEITEDIEKGAEPPSIKKAADRLK